MQHVGASVDTCRALGAGITRDHCCPRIRPGPEGRGVKPCKEGAHPEGKVKCLMSHAGERGAVDCRRWRSPHRRNNLLNSAAEGPMGVGSHKTSDTHM